MKDIHRLKLLSIVLVLAYLLSACSGVAIQPGVPAGGKPQSNEFAFTGTVQSINTGEITVSGQIVSIDAKTIVDPNIKVGDIVKVEASISETGNVLAVKVEAFEADTAIPTISTDGAATPAVTEPPALTSAPDPLVTQTTNGSEKEIFGVVDFLSTDSITVDGVVYPLSPITEFKNAIFAGDTVKLHVMIEVNGSFTLREIEKVSGTILEDNNTTSDDSSNDDLNDDENDDNGNDD
jgi:hypothetical protein